MKHKIGIKSYSYECGDGCCVEFGYEYYVDGEFVHRSPCEDSGWLAVLSALGIQAEIVNLSSDDGEEVCGIDNFSDFQEKQTVSLHEKVKQYEEFLHKINMMTIAGDHKAIQKLVENADKWSYSHRVGNGELSEEEQQKIIDKAFWKLNEL
jgi:hypothetical protein